jgi:hypothetical protein
MSVMLTSTVVDFFGFFRAWLSDPVRVGAVIPSSSVLADAITAEISPATAPVIELGAGTGVFTRALLARGVPEDSLALIDYGSDFARLLQFRFPRARTLWMDAGRLKDVELFRRRTRRRRRERVAAAVDVPEKGDRDPRGLIRAFAARGRVLPIHLWTSLPGATRAARPARAEGDAHRLGVRQRPTGRSLPHSPTSPTARHVGKYTEAMARL